MSVFTYRREVVAPAVEAFVAGQFPGSEWVGGRSPVDVAAASDQIDVKTGFIHKIRTADGEVVSALGFMGSGRDQEARDSVTHYAVVVPAYEDGTATVADDGSVTMRIDAPDAWYLIPSEQVNAEFAPKCNRKGQSTGLNLYAPLDRVARWRRDLP